MLLLIALGGIFVDAYDLTSLGIGVDSLREQLSLTPFQLGSVTAIMALGALVGALVGGVLTDRFGRYKMFIVNLLFLFFAAIGAALSSNLAWLLVFRFLLGVGVGMDLPLALTFIAEFTNSRIKGMAVNLWHVVWYVAAVCTGLVALPFLLVGVDENLWRYAVGFAAIPALLILILIYVDESPMWAAPHQGLEAAGKILEKNYKVRTIVAPEEERLREAVPRRGRPRLREIFSEKFRMRTVLASIITSTQAMECFAVGFLQTIAQWFAQLRWGALMTTTGNAAVRTMLHGASRRRGE